MPEDNPFQSPKIAVADSPNSQTTPSKNPEYLNKLDYSHVRNGLRLTYFGSISFLVVGLLLAFADRFGLFEFLGPTSLVGGAVIAFMSLLLTFLGMCMCAQAPCKNEKISAILAVALQAVPLFAQLGLWVFGLIFGGEYEFYSLYQFFGILFAVLSHIVFALFCMQVAKNIELQATLVWSRRTLVCIFVVFAWYFLLFVLALTVLSPTVKVGTLGIEMMFVVPYLILSFTYLKMIGAGIDELKPEIY